MQWAISRLPTKATSKYDLFWPMPLALSYFQLGPFQWSVWDMAGECAWRCSNKTFLQSALHSTVSQLNSTLQVDPAALPCVAQIADCTAAHTPQYTSSWSKTTLQWCGWLVTTNHFLLCYICYICIHCCYICICHLLRLKFPSKEWPGPKVFCQYAAVHSVGLNWNDRTKFNLCVCKPSWHETFPLNQLLTAVTDFGWPKNVSASRSRSQEKDSWCSSASEPNLQMPLVLHCHPVVQATPIVYDSFPTRKLKVKYWHPHAGPIDHGHWSLVNNPHVCHPVVQAAPLDYVLLPLWIFIDIIWKLMYGHLSY